MRLRAISQVASVQVDPEIFIETYDNLMLSVEEISRVTGEQNYTGEIFNLDAGKTISPCEELSGHKALMAVKNSRRPFPNAAISTPSSI